MIKNLNINDYYFHSLIHGANEGLKVVDDILKAGAIKSPQSLGVRARVGCHYPNEICLSQVTSGVIKPDTISCFDIYVPRLTSLMIDKEVSKKCHIFKPQVVTTEEAFWCHSNSKTNLYDEYRTNNDIPIEYIKGLCIPYHNLVNDPLAFVPFIVEDILMAYYNGNLDGYYQESVLNSESSKQAYDRRRDILNSYVVQLQKILQDNHFDVPIYYCENDNDRKLVLR